jgi:hypothetical protein
MTKLALTNEEKRCLQMWFRQAIAQLEREEATDRMLRQHGANDKVQSSHHTIELRRRPTRSRPAVARTKEMAV